MDEVKLKGVQGMSLTIDNEGVTFTATTGVARGALGTDERRILFTDITDRSFKPANMAMNGRINIVTENGLSSFPFMYGGGARAAKEGFERIVEMTAGASDETSDRGLTTKQEIEGQTAKELRASARGSIGGFMDLMKDVRQAMLFPGLTFDADTVTYKGVSQPIAGASAVVDSAGALTRRPTLARVAAGGMLFGGAGALGGGLLQKKNDARTLFLLIDGTQAAWAVPVKPDRTADATKFAALFNTAAKQATVAAVEQTPPDSPTLPPSTTGVAERLSTLAGLHAQGVLSDDEFTQAKASVLRGD